MAKNGHFSTFSGLFRENIESSVFQIGGFWKTARKNRQNWPQNGHFWHFWPFLTKNRKKIAFFRKNRHFFEENLSILSKLRFLTQKSEFLTCFWLKTTNICSRDEENSVFWPDFCRFGQKPVRKNTKKYKKWKNFCKKMKNFCEILKIFSRDVFLKKTESLFFTFCNFANILFKNVTLLSLLNRERTSFSKNVQKTFFSKTLKMKKLFFELSKQSFARTKQSARREVKKS